MRFFLALLGLLGCTAALAAVPACDMHSCTEMACMDAPHTIALEPAAGWADGDYVVRIEAGGQVATCEGHLPEPSCGFVANCTGGDFASVAGSGCDAKGQPIAPIIALRTIPDIVRVTITRDGAELVDRQVPLAYSLDEPNGPDCPPFCRHAEGSPSVAF